MSNQPLGGTVNEHMVGVREAKLTGICVAKSGVSLGQCAQ